MKTSKTTAFPLMVFALALWAESAAGTHLSDAEKTAFAEWYGRVRCENFFEPYRHGRPLGIPWFVVVVDFDLDGDGAQEIVMYDGYECGTGGAVWHAFKKTGSGWEDIEAENRNHAMARWESYLWIVETEDGRHRLSSNEPRFMDRRQFYDDGEFERLFGRFGVARDQVSSNIDNYDCIVNNTTHWMEADGILHSDESTNGVTQMILDPGFRHLERIRPQRFSGTNFVHLPLSPPAWPELSPYRLCNETNSVDVESRAALISQCKADGMSVSNALVVFVDMGFDHSLDALVGERDSIDSSGKLLWFLYRPTGKGWIRSVVPSVSEHDDIPDVPPSFRAGTNDLYRVWTASQESYLNVFIPEGSGLWDVRSPFSEGKTPQSMLDKLRVGNVRANYTDWTEVFGTRPPHDFYQLFEPGSPMIQLDRLLPENLLP